MTPDRWEQVEKLYHAARARTAEERAAFLDAACAADAALRREVESLLAQPVSGAGFLDEPAVAAQLMSNPAGSLLAGRRIGAYQLQALLGAGGMGEVYRARDPKLGRDVAIKILPRVFTTDPERLARFEREARMLASLNHPHIGAIYGLEDADGVRALVLELVEGETLADRLRRGRLPLTEALTMARQIADALEAAHEKGIIHRDLKPANIKITPSGVVKVLDFGLAKVVAGDGANPDLVQSPTMTVDGTREGVILGTAAYMSPEQARGQAVDKRTDIWAFGCVLFDMLSGHEAFPGDTVSDVISAILGREPAWDALPANTPTSIHRLLRRALEKDRRERLPDIGAARIELKEALTTPAAEVTRAVDAPRRRRARLIAWTLAAVAVSTIALGMQYRRSTPVTGGSPIRLSVVLPPNVTPGAGVGSTIPAVSPDGRRVAVVATQAATSLLWVRSLDSLETKALPGTEQATFPFWSPDSRTLGFFTADGTLKTIDASGGPVRSLCEVPGGAARGGTWNSDGVIVFGTEMGGLFTVSASGGSPVPLTTPDALHAETAHRFPYFLPDSRQVLYRAFPSNMILLGSLDSKETTRVLTAQSQAVYVAPESLLYMRQGTLVAQPFDVRRGTLLGDAVPVAEQVMFELGAGGAAAFGASSSGVLVYRTRTLGARTQLTWVDRAGKPLGPVGPPGHYRNPELSPDGMRVALELTDPQTHTQDVWLVDLVRGVTSRMTFDRANDIYPIWSPDANWIMFGSDRSGVFNLYQKRTNGAGGEEVVLKSPGDMVPYSWSPDGRTVVYRVGSRSPFNMGILPLGGEQTPRTLEASRFNQSYGQVSPDGRWLAHTFNESGRYEVYVRSFAGPGGGKWQVSKDGAVFPRWRHDSRELFYYAVDGWLRAVPVAGATAPDVGAAVPLFEAHMLNGPAIPVGFRHQYDVARDGQRFLINVPVEDTTVSPITVVINWPAALKK